LVWSKFKRGEDSDKESITDIDVPSSLPATLLDKKGEIKKSEQKIEPPKDKHRLPEDLAKPQEFKKINFVSKPLVDEVKEDNSKIEANNYVPQKNNEDSSSHSYFKELEKKFVEDKEISHKHFSDDLISKMKEYHESKIKGEVYFFNEKDSDDHVYKHLLELKELESEWSVRFREFEAAKELLIDKEKEIESKVQTFKKVFEDGERFKLFNKRCDKEVAFRLENGHLLRSLQDLVNELNTMSDEVFYHHVNAERNDFEAWIRYVFNSKNVADKISGFKSRQDIIFSLNNV
jgi:hypothetical protein